MYKIKKYSFDQAKLLNVEIKQQQEKIKKLMCIKIIYLFVLLEILNIQTILHI